jgi:predicted glycosyltransferase
MRVLIDINHPAHVHFFRNPIAQLRAEGHEVLATGRDKDITIPLLNEFEIPCRVISAQGIAGRLGLARELVQRDWSLARVARDFCPEVMGAIGGTFIAHVGAVLRIPSVVFYDTENAVLQNAITFPLASCVIVPRCYRAWVPRKRNLRYAGYHELSYLHPSYFTPDRDLAISNGLAPQGDTFMLRLVSWQANHDLGEHGWTMELLGGVVDRLGRYGKVLISAEGVLREDLEAYRYQGRVSEIHHVMAFCRAFVGESATMASECAVLGVPAVYMAKTGRGYTDEQESRYGLVRNVRELTWEALDPVLDEVLGHRRAHWERRRERLLEDTVDVAGYVKDRIVGCGERRKTGRCCQ